MTKGCFFMIDREYFNNLSDDKALFDEVLPPADIDDELEEEYLAGVDYEEELEEHKKGLF